MSNFEIQEALQLRQQRFTAALAFSNTTHEYVDIDGEVVKKQATFDQAIEMADELIAKLEAPNK